MTLSQHNLSHKEIKSSNLSAFLDKWRTKQYATYNIVIIAFILFGLLWGKRDSSKLI